MGLMDKLKGNSHGHDSHATTTTPAAGHGTTVGGGAYDAYDGGRTGTTGTHVPGQDPYNTHGATTTGNTSHSGGGIFGTHKDNNQHGHSHSSGHHHAQDGVVADGAYGTHGNVAGSTMPAGAAAGYGAPNTTSTGHHDSGLVGNKDHHSSSSGGGLLGRKKDDIEESLERERQAKIELDKAMAKHQAAQGDASKQLQAKEDAARAELAAAQRRLEEAQGLRSKHGL